MPMTLDEWIKFEHERLERYRTWYLTQQRENPAEEWPSTASPGDWDDQYLMFSDPEGPESTA